MSEHLDDEEQLEALKRWWKENGVQLFGIAVITVGGWYGWQYWQQKQQQLAAESSVIYSAMLETAAQWKQDDLADTASVVNAHAETLKGLNGDSQYAHYGALMIAKLAMADKDFDVAAAELTAVMITTDDESLKRLAKFRLARVEVARGNDEQALALLKEGDAAEFTALYAELKGDIFFRQGDIESARAAYQLAVDNLDGRDIQAKGLIELKLNEMMPNTNASVGSVEEDA